MTIGTLSDDVLLEIFNIYLAQSGNIEAWHTLVHVCRQWRCVVFASPVRLNLRLLCKPKRPVAMALDIWPIFPIVVDFEGFGKRPRGMRSIVAALKQHNRVCSINIQNIPNLLLKTFAVLRKPFPTLTKLRISSGYGVVPIVPDSFLGGSTPQLRVLHLVRIPFPELGKLLLSTSNLVDLNLQRIPHSGYISPQEIVAGLSTSMGLKRLALGFQSPQSWDDRANWDPPPLTRIVLPALIRLMFKGDNQYLEAIVSRIDAPLLDSLEITFFNQLMFDTPLLGHFVSRTETFTAIHRADVDFHTFGVQITLVRGNEISDNKTLTMLILCKQSEWQPSTIAQVCNSIIPPLPTLGKLRIGKGPFQRLQWYDDMENIEWLELLQPFTCVKDLVLSRRLVPLVAPALQELDGERVTQILPVLKNIFLEGTQPLAVTNTLGKFIAARQLSGNPVTIRVLAPHLRRSSIASVMTDTSGYRSALQSPMPTSPSVAKVGPGPLRQRKPKVALPKDDFGVSNMMAIIELAGSQDKPPPPEPVHPVEEMLFGRPIQMDELHPAIREIFAPTFKQLDDMDQASITPSDRLRVFPELIYLCAFRCSTNSSSKHSHSEN